MGRGRGEAVRTCLKAEADGRARKVLLGSEICQPGLTVPQVSEEVLEGEQDKL